MKVSWTILLAVVSMSTAWAQGQQDQERVQELERQKQLQDRIIPPEFLDESYFDYGGWIRPQYFQFRDGSGAVRGRHEYDFRVWLDIRQGGIHNVYFRGAYYKFFWDDEDSPTGHDEKQKFRIDVAYYQLDIPVTNSMGARESIGYLRGGRQYHVLGSGLVFNGQFDGGKAGLAWGPLAVTAFAGRSVPETDDMDHSITDPLMSFRLFYSAMIEGNFSSMVVPYVFALAQDDMNPESPDIATQEFEWNSQYWGAGARGNVFIPNVTFLVEYTLETGRRYASGATRTQEHIEAQAIVSQLTFRLLDSPMVPQAYVGFLWATGDSDRTFVPNTFLGNAIGTPDHSFTAFGYYPTGYVFNPILSNLHVFQAGASARPIYPDVLTVMQVDVGVDFYYYTKVKSRGGISDPFMKLRHHDVGWEIDVHADWTVVSDFTLQVRYGLFHAGREPLEDGDRHFFLIAGILSF